MTHKKLLKYNLLCLAMSGIFVQIAYADTTTNTTKATPATTASDEPSTTLSPLKVTFKNRAHRRTNEITGLGKVVKNDNDIDEELTLNIRDLTRYDPGISVVEQGRGATSGYAMRGVDKNRVAMSVDGLAQAQSYLTLKSGANGGAINEIEYENIKSIELSKGASSAEYGNGALGGAVGFVTKNSSDVIKAGQNWGLDTKTAYSSKNEQFTQSIAGGFKHGKFDHLAILTWRKGHETDIHKAAKSLTQTYYPLVGYFEKYDNRDGSSSDNYYILKDDCPTLDCTPKVRAVANNNSAVRQTGVFAPLTGEALEESTKIAYPAVTATAEEYTGAGRIAPNPMDYKSDSFFYKGGYQLSPAHYFGAVLERTNQRYDIRDMTYRSYYTEADVYRNNLRGCGFTTGGYAVGNCGISDDNNPLGGLVFVGNDMANGESVRYGAKYAKGLFIDERHQKDRYGLFYEYKNPFKNGWADSIKISLDQQDIDLDTHRHETRCSVGSVEKCRASADKEWSYYNSERNLYTERLTLGQLNWQKYLELGNTRHKFNVLMGAGKFKSTMNHGEFFEEFATGRGYNLVARNRGTATNPSIYERGDGVPMVIRDDVCDSRFGGNADCTPRAITGNQAFIGVKDFININPYLDVGLGVRYDKHKFEAEDAWTVGGRYNNWSWNTGVTVKPTNWLVMSYRYSNGFRVPAFYELYGVRTGIGFKDNPIVQQEMLNRVAPKAEKSHNHEFGVGFKGDFGSLEASVFRNTYDGMIAQGQVNGLTAPDFFNLQDVKLQGVNVLGKLDWQGIYGKLPQGLYSTLAYNEVKVKERTIKDGYNITIDPILDAVQPARVIGSLGYDSPTGAWGVETLATYSKAKNDNELTANRYYGSVSLPVLGKKSRSWYTYDLTGYYHFGKNYTVRAGVYNLLNRKYSTWESVRQSTINAVNQDNGNALRFAAPDRNFVLSFEAKF